MANPIFKYFKNGVWHPTVRSIIAGIGVTVTMDGPDATIDAPGSITEITSGDGSVVVTNPTGPVVDLSVDLSSAIYTPPNNYELWSGNDRAVVVNGATKDMSFDTKITDGGILDNTYTDGSGFNSKPTIIDDGLYAISVSILASSFLDAGANFKARLLASTRYGGSTNEGTSVGHAFQPAEMAFGTHPKAKISLNMTAYLYTDDDILVQVTNNSPYTGDPTASHNFHISRFLIQRIS